MILVVVDIVSAPGKRDAVVSASHALLGDGPPGLNQYAIGLSHENAAKLTIVEEWADVAAHEAFMKSESLAAFRAESAALYASAPVSRTFDIDVPSKPTISLL